MSVLLLCSVKPLRVQLAKEWRQQLATAYCSSTRDCVDKGWWIGLVNACLVTSPYSPNIRNLINCRQRLPENFKFVSRTAATSGRHYGVNRRL